MLRLLDDIPGLWPTLRHDSRLSGHQPLPGSIRHPEVHWRHRLAGPVYDGRTIAAEVGADILVLYGGRLHRHACSGELIWRSQTIGLESVVGVEDVDGDGRTEILASTGKSIIVLDAADGCELWSEYLGPPLSGGFMHTAALLFRILESDATMCLAVGLLSSCEVVIYDFSAGAESTQRKHVLWMDDFFHPSLLAVDVDRDGRTELVVTKLSSLFVFDPETGVLKSECRWSSGGTPKRNYGAFRAVDLNGDGLPDFVVVSDRVSRHIAVVENSADESLRVSWDRFYEHIYDSDDTELRASPEVCVDIDGDGRKEIIVSLFNAEGDGRWWLEVIDALTGEERLRLPDLYLRGIDETARDGAQIFVSAEYERVPGTWSRSAVLRWQEGRLSEVFALERSSFVGRLHSAEPDRALFRSDLPPADGVRIEWVDSEPRIILRHEDSGIVLVGAVDVSTKTVPGTRDVCSVLAVDDFDGDGRTELALCDRDGTVWLMQADGTVVGSFRAGVRFRPGSAPYYAAKPAAVPIVFASTADRYCVLPDAAGLIRVLRWSVENHRPVEVCSLAARGRLGPEESYHSASAVELDGRVAVLAAPLGESAVAAFDVDGTRMATWRVSRLPVTEDLPVARTGIHEYLALPGSADLMISGFRSSSMNSEITVRAGVDGAELWKGAGIEVPGHVLAFAPWSAASIGTDGPILFLAKDTLCEIDAASGEFRHAPWQLRPLNAADMKSRGLRMDDFAAYGSIIPADVDGDGLDEWITIGNYGGHGVIGSDHRARWWRAEPLSSLTAGFGGLCDVDGDGRLELGVSTAAGDVICLDAASGLEKWRLHLGDVAHGIATCDIDGDGRSEYILATRGGELVCVGVGSNGSGSIRWRLRIGYSLGAPIAADFDGDGRSEILVVAGDGYLYSVGERRL